MLHARPTADAVHYNDVIMSAVASQITSLTIVYSTVYSRRTSKKTPKIHVTGLCEGNSPVIGEFPSEKANNAENVSTWWRHISIQSLVFSDVELRFFDQTTLLKIADVIWWVLLAFRGSTCEFIFIARYYRSQMTNPPITKKPTGCLPSDLSRTVFV